MTDLRVTDFTLTLENNLKPRWGEDLPPAEALAEGVKLIEGTVTVYWDATPRLRHWMRTYEGRVRNTVLRMARPHMPKRMFQRLRGRMRAQRRDR